MAHLLAKRADQRDSSADQTAKVFEEGGGTHADTLTAGLCGDVALALT
jgi:hypothetical protein